MSINAWSLKDSRRSACRSKAKLGSDSHSPEVPRPGTDFLKIGGGEKRKIRPPSPLKATKSPKPVIAGEDCAQVYTFFKSGGKNGSTGGGQPIKRMGALVLISKQRSQKLLYQTATTPRALFSSNTKNKERRERNKNLVVS